MILNLCPHGNRRAKLVLVLKVQCTELFTLLEAHLEIYGIHNNKNRSLYFDTLLQDIKQRPSYHKYYNTCSVLSMKFGPKRGEVTGKWRKLHNEEPHDHTPLAIKLKRMRQTGYEPRMTERRVVYRVLVGKPQEKTPLGRPRRRLEDNIKMDLQEVGCGGCGLD
jgi:hypothetical protein